MSSSMDLSKKTLSCAIFLTVVLLFLCTSYTLIKIVAFTISYSQVPFSNSYHSLLSCISLHKSHEELQKFKTILGNLHCTSAQYMDSSNFKFRLPKLKAYNPAKISILNLRGSQHILGVLSAQNGNLNISLTLSFIFQVYTVVVVRYQCLLCLKPPSFYLLKSQGECRELL